MIFILIIAYAVFFYTAFKALMILGTIIEDGYDDLDKSKSDQNRRKNIKSDGKTKKSGGLFRKFIGYQIRIFGKFDFERGLCRQEIAFFSNWIKKAGKCFNIACGFGIKKPVYVGALYGRRAGQFIGNIGRFLRYHKR